MARWTVALTLSIAIFLPLTEQSFAERTRPAGTSGTGTTGKSCDRKHEACISYCIGAKKDGGELRTCTEGCAGLWLSCKHGPTRK